MTDESKKQIVKEQQEKNDYRDCFNTKAGKRTFESMKKYARVNIPSAFPHFETSRTLWNDGIKAMILHIETIQNRDMEQVRKLYETRKKEGGE